MAHAEKEEGVRLTDLQREVLGSLPDWIGAGIPVGVIAQRCERPNVRSALYALIRRGFAERDKPNEEWPFIYAATPAGRAALAAEEPRND